MFKDIDSKWWKSYTKKMEEFDDFMQEITDVPPWKSWYAWKPVKDIHGKRHWMKKIYRRVNDRDWRKYEYGTIFDVIKDGN